MTDRPAGGNPLSKGVAYNPENPHAMKHIPRILAIDGGGIRGLSSLLILEKLRQEIQRLNGDNDLPLPSKYFDLICGTSTGGIIAIMLGQLCMINGP
jgi:patatin-like phospholipase/acyl hydrolase